MLRARAAFLAAPCTILSQSLLLIICKILHNVGWYLHCLVPYECMLTDWEGEVDCAAPFMRPHFMFFPPPYITCAPPPTPHTHTHFTQETTTIQSVHSGWLSRQQGSIPLHPLSSVSPPFELPRRKVVWFLHANREKNTLIELRGEEVGKGVKTEAECH